MSETRQPLPAGWAYASPRDLASSDRHSLGIGPFGSNLKVSDYREKGTPLVFVRNIRSESFGATNDAKFVSSVKADELAAHQVLPGDLLVTKMGDPPGDACLYPANQPPAIITADCIRWRLDASIPNPAYFVYAIRSPDVQRQILAITKGVAQRKVSLGRFEGVRVPVAPLPEQTRIVEAIESYFTRLDNAVATLERVQANLKRYRASVLKSAVEGRLVPTEAELARQEGRDYEPASVLLEHILKERRRRWEEAELAALKAKSKVPKDDKWKAKYKEPVAPDTLDLPGLPEGWCWAKLPQLTCGNVGMKTGPFGSLLKKHEHRATGVPVLGIENIEPMRFVPGSKIHISEEKANELEAYDVQPGDLVISRSGTVGEVCVVPDGVGEARFSTNVMRVRFIGSGILPEFIALALNGSPYVRKQISRLCKGTTRDFLNQRILCSLNFPLPPLAEQGRILDETKRLASLTDAVTHAGTEAAQRSSRLRQSILKWAFEGKLADQDPNDEPASALLERIKAERGAKAAEDKPKTRKKRNGRKRSAA